MRNRNRHFIYDKCIYLGHRHVKECHDNIIYNTPNLKTKMFINSKKNKLWYSHSIKYYNDEKELMEYAAAWMTRTMEH